MMQSLFFLDIQNDKIKKVDDIVEAVSECSRLSNLLTENALESSTEEFLVSGRLRGLSMIDHRQNNNSLTLHQRNTLSELNNLRKWFMPNHTLQIDHQQSLGCFRTN
jgi:hypothetical protein